MKVRTKSTLLATCLVAGALVACGMAWRFRGIVEVTDESMLGRPLVVALLINPPGAPDQLAPPIRNISISTLFATESLEVLRIPAGLFKNVCDESNTFQLVAWSPPSLEGVIVNGGIDGQLLTPAPDDPIAWTPHIPVDCTVEKQRVTLQFPQ